MNFQNLTGKRTQAPELASAWIENGVLGPNSTEQAMNGKAYVRATQAHKLTFQATVVPAFPTTLGLYSSA